MLSEGAKPRFASARAETFLQTQYGAEAVRRFAAWQQGMRAAESRSEDERLVAVNELVNRHVRFTDDALIWQQPDYWATPLETLGQGAGDCEDFALAKYFSLILLGVAPEKLRLVYVKARLGGPDSRLSQAHMVLAYYPEPTAEPLILDNLLGEIRPASRRPDLKPVYSFNHDGVWAGQAGGKAPDGSITRLSRWQAVVARMDSEGFPRG